MKRRRPIGTAGSSLRLSADARAARRSPPAPAEDLVTRRLAETLHQRTSEYRTDATVDLTMIDALLEHEGPAAARTALDGHAAALEALLENLHAAVAQAAAEREVQEILAPPAPLPTMRERVKAHVSSIAGAAAVLMALAASGPRIVAERAVLTAGGDQVESASNIESSVTPATAGRRASAARPAATRTVRAKLLRVSEPRARSVDKGDAAATADLVEDVTQTAVRAAATAPPAGRAQAAQRPSDGSDAPAADEPTVPLPPNVDVPRAPALEPDPVDSNLSIEPPPVDVGAAPTPELPEPPRGPAAR